MRSILLLGFIFKNIWFRKISTFSMFDELFHVGFAIIFSISFSCSECFEAMTVFGFRASALLFYRVLWSNIVLNIFIVFLCLTFACEVICAHHVDRFWKQHCKTIKLCEVLYGVLYNISTLHMFDKLFHIDFAIVFQFRFRLLHVLKQWLFWFWRSSFVTFRRIVI